MYVLVDNQTVREYPYNLKNLRRNYPNVSFPIQLNDSLLSTYNIFPVFDPGQPDHDQLTQSVDEFPPAFVVSNDRWERQWAVRDATAQEIADRKSVLINKYTDMIQSRLDEFAQTRNYDGILSACTYATSPTVKFATEGQYCVEQRDATWATLYTILAEVEAGTRPIPTSFEDIEPDLPVLAWPN